MGGKKKKGKKKGKQGNHGTAMASNAANEEAREQPHWMAQLYKREMLLDTLMRYHGQPKNTEKKYKM